MVSSIAPSPLIVTTLPLGRISHYIDHVCSWAKNYRVIVIISSSDIQSYPEQVEILDKAQIHWVTLDFSIASSVDSTSSIFSKKTPTLAQLWDVFFRLRDATDSILFVNADIELAQGQESKISQINNNCLRHQHIVFFHRWDYVRDATSPPCPYLQGFDAFLLPLCMLDSCSGERLSLFSIGQVGWDYALPLFFDHSKVIKSSSLRILHRTHPSTSTACWDQAMMQVMKCLHPSHLQRQSMWLRYFAYSVSFSWSIAYKAINFRSHLEGLRNIVGHLYSRISYYIVIRTLLKALKGF